MLLLISCSKENNISTLVLDVEPPELEVALEPGSRTSKGGLIINQDLLLDKDMNFAYLRVRDFDDDLVQGRDEGYSYVPEVLDLRVREIVYDSFKDNFDFIAVLVSAGGAWPSFFLSYRCASEGIGCQYDESISKRFKGFIAHPGDKGYGGYVVFHEIAHYWGNYGVIPTTEFYHWGYSNVGGFIGGYDEITYLGNKIYQGSYVKDNAFADNSITHKYGNLELYLMGLIPANELRPIIVAENPKVGVGDLNEIAGRFSADTLTTIQPDEFIGTWGERFPSFENSQKEFKMLILIVSNKNVVEMEKDEEKSRSLGQDIEVFSDIGSIEDIKNNDTYSFWRATGGRATMETKISMDDLIIPIK